MKTFFAFVLLAISAMAVFSQEDTKKWSFETTIYSQYSWRGEQLSDVPIIAPAIEFATGNFSLCLWGAKATNKDYSEIDIVPSYSFGDFTIELCDYYFPVAGEENNYFNLRENESRHSVELSLKYEATEKFPVRWSLGTFIAGDKNTDTNKQFYSTYLEAGVPFSLIGIDFEPVIGLTPFKGFYAPKLAVINTGFTAQKDIELGKNWKLPLQVFTSYNPQADQFFLNLAVGFRFN